MLLTEAQVVSDNGDGTYSIYIPLLNSNYKATVCYTSGVVPVLLSGMVVYASFKDNDIGSPVILGVKQVAGSTPSGMGNLSSLSVENSTTLSATTTIGEVTYQNLSCLIGCTESISGKLATIQQELEGKNTSELSNVTKMVLSTDMYGTEDAMNAIESPEVGRLFFVIAPEE